jgi:hypothetical protein
MIKAGFAKKDISPDKPLPGRLGLNHIIEPYHPISAKAAAVESNDGLVLMIVCEIVGLTISEIKAIRELITKKTGIPGERIVITCTHTHASPWVWDLQDEEARKLGFKVLDREWMKKVINRTASAGIEAMAVMKPVAVKYGIAETKDIVSNRVSPVTRWSVCNDDELRNAPAGNIDPNVRTISFHEPNGKPLFIFSNLAVHPTAWGGGKTLKVSPDFPYIAENMLKSDFGKKLILAYWQGCAGNSNSGKYVKKGSEKEVTVIGGRLYEALAEALNSAIELESGFEYKYKKFSLPVGEFVSPPDIARERFRGKCMEINPLEPSDEDVFKWRRALKQLDVSILSNGKAMEMEFQLLKFAGTDVLFVPGEWYVQIYKNLAALRPERNLIITTLNNFDLLYIPDEESMPYKEWYGVKTDMRSLGNESAVKLYEEAADFIG